MPDLCLFTNELLHEETKEEHTIPRSIGGRIKSRKVSSSDFNQLCGQTVDPYLTAAYGEICRSLAPFMATENKQGYKVVISENGIKRCRLNEDDILELAKTEVPERDENGKPKVMLFKSEEKAKEFVKKQGISEKDYSISMEQLTNEQVYYCERVTCSTEMEIALLKCSLLSFDHFLHTQHEKKRFTRDQSLDEVKNVVNDALKNKDTTSNGPLEHLNVDFVKWNSISLGLQFEKLDQIKKIRSRIDYKISPFEHFLIATGNAGTKTIDIIFFAFSWEPWGFRVANNWTGGDFQYCIINPIFRDESASGIHMVSYPVVSCSHTNYRSTAYLPHKNETDNKCYFDEMAKFRNELHMKAKAYVEINATDFVWKQLASPCDNVSVSERAKKRILKYYISASKDDKEKIEATILNAKLQNYERNKAEFMANYSKIFKEIRKLFPYQSSVFTKETHIDIHKI